MRSLKEEIRKQKIFKSIDFTYEEYVDQLIKLQKTVCQFTFNDEYHEQFRIGDAITKVKCYAISKDLNNSEIYYRGMDALKLIEKELAITFSGRKAENHVDNILKKYVTRDDFSSYRGIYLNNGSEDTEIDNLILTKNGFLLLEIKNIKSDVHISEEGRLFVNGDCSFEQIPLGEKMNRKRNLFKSEIKKALKKKGVHIDIDLHSLVVFNEPRNTKCYITNHSNEKWCKSNQLGYIVNEFSNKFPYSTDQFNILNESCKEFETHQKKFSVNYDIESTVDDICSLFDLLETNRKSIPNTKIVNKRKIMKFPESWSKLKFHPFLKLYTRTCILGSALLGSSVILNLVTKE